MRRAGPYLDWQLSRCLQAAALVLAVTVLGSAEGGASSGTCTYEQKQVRIAAVADFKSKMIATRRAYFRTHKSKAQRATFVRNAAAEASAASGDSSVQRPRAPAELECELLTQAHTQGGRRSERGSDRSSTPAASDGSHRECGPLPRLSRRTGGPDGPGYPRALLHPRGRLVARGLERSALRLHHARHPLDQDAFADHGLPSAQ